jgi:hypothetical protein
VDLQFARREGEDTVQTRYRIIGNEMNCNRRSMNSGGVNLVKESERDESSSSGEGSADG